MHYSYKMTWVVTTELFSIECFIVLLLYYYLKPYELNTLWIIKESALFSSLFFGWDIGFNVTYPLHTSPLFKHTVSLENVFQLKYLFV